MVTRSHRAFSILINPTVPAYGIKGTSDDGGGGGGGGHGWSVLEHPTSRSLLLMDSPSWTWTWTWTWIWIWTWTWIWTWMLRPSIQLADSKWWFLTSKRRSLPVTVCLLALSFWIGAGIVVVVYYLWCSFFKSRMYMQRMDGPHNTYAFVSFSVS